MATGVMIHWVVVGNRARVEVAADFMTVVHPQNSHRAWASSDLVEHLVVLVLPDLQNQPGAVYSYNVSGIRILSTVYA